MKFMGKYSGFGQRSAMVALGFSLVVVCAGAQESEETEERIRIAAANMEDAIVVDCQLPGKLRRLGGSRNYLTPGRLIRASAIVCRTRGGEYTLGDLASGTLSLQRWMVPAKGGDAEAQYYVARIYANGMDNVDIDYAEAASWYQMAADQDYAEAKQELGYLYERGLGVEQDELKALNLQREASGLGDALDYSYKIADAHALAASLATQLRAANNALADSQLELMDMQARLTAARNNARQQDLQIVALVADLEDAKRIAADASSPKIVELEGELANVSAQLEQSQTTILELERARASANSALAMQMAGGQATQLELRELLARTENAEQGVDSLTAQLAEAQSRLLRSNKEVRDLQLVFREQSDEVAGQRERMLEARSRSDSDAAAYMAGQEAQLASRAARVTSLEAQLISLQAQLASSQSTAVADGLRQELGVLQTRYDNDVTALQQDQGRLRKNYSSGKKELATLYAESKLRLADKDGELDARKREIDVLALESGRLQARVEQLESQQRARTRQTDLNNARTQAGLAMARQKAVNLRSALEDAHAEKSALESKLLRDQIELQERMTAANTSSESELELLRAEVAAAQSTVNLQNLRISALEKQADEGAASLAALKIEAGDTDTIAIEMPKALSVLRMAQSAEEDPNLGQFHALLIANEAYVNMPRLNTPIRDVRDIEKLLITRYGFEVQVLTDATDDMIMRALHDYSNTLTDEDNLMIYYAGRGSTPDGPPDRAYWLGVDADPELRNTWLLAEHISDKIKQIDARRILVVTDSCFSRRRVQPKSAALGRGVDPNIFRQMASLKSRVVLTSGANVPVSEETGDRTHSLFAKYFMEILRQNDNVLSGEMLSYELGSRVREKVENPERVTPSYTSLQDAGHRGGDFFFVPVRKPLMVARAPTGQDSA